MLSGTSEPLGSRVEWSEERGGSIEEHRAIGGSVAAVTYKSPTYHIPIEVVRDWPEAITIFEKLAEGEGLGGREVLWVREAAEAAGWDVEDMVDELSSLDVDPSERVERYKSLFESYYEEALRREREGDTRQAGEKAWGAVTALIKLYAALKGVYIAHWSLARLYRFVENNVEAEYREVFTELLNRAFILHMHFYEAHLGPEQFRAEWRKVIELIDKAREIVFRRL